MPDLPPIPDKTLEILKEIPTQTLIDALWVKNWPMGYVEGSRPLQLGQKMAGRAVTLRFVPHRPDLAEDKPKGDQSAEYVAFELCGPGEVLVIDAMRWTYSSVGGDIKFFRLHQRVVGGLVTDGVWRGDSRSVSGGGMWVFRQAMRLRGGHGATPEQMVGLVQASLAECERYYPAFQFVLWGGKSPEEAIAASILDTQGEA